jgi:hypothetical protein
MHRSWLVHISIQLEANFLGALTAAGVVATSPCVYSFPATTVTEFLALAQVIEGYHPFSTQI